jgi:3-hydroxyisobutyrate dehydrogenase
MTIGAHPPVAGFVGLGTMGAPIARRLLAAGVSLFVKDPSEKAIQEIAAHGATSVDTFECMCRRAKVIFLSLPTPAIINDVITGPSGILSAATAGTYIVDLSTNSLEMVRTLHSVCAEVGVTYIDAPISGGSAGAEKGTLSIMLGGSNEAVAVVSPFLKSFCENIFHVGQVGAGAIAKLVNNQIFLTGAVAVQEGLVLAKKAGIDESTLLKILNSSSAKVYAGLAPLFLNREFEKVVFRLDIASKDMDVALDSAKELGFEMPTTQAASQTYRRAISQGLGEKVFYATLSTIDT